MYTLMANAIEWFSVLLFMCCYSWLPGQVAMQQIMPSYDVYTFMTYILMIRLIFMPSCDRCMECMAWWYNNDAPSGPFYSHHVPFSLSRSCLKAPARFCPAKLTFTERMDSCFHADFTLDKLNCATLEHLEFATLAQPGCQPLAWGPLTPCSPPWACSHCIIDPWAPMLAWSGVLYACHCGMMDV